MKFTSFVLDSLCYLIVGILTLMTDQSFHSYLFVYKTSILHSGDMSDVNNCVLLCNIILIGDTKQYSEMFKQTSRSAKSYWKKKYMWRRKVRVTNIINLWNPVFILTISHTSVMIEGIWQEYFTHNAKDYEIEL